jgi:cytochrome P450
MRLLSRLFDKGAARRRSSPTAETIDLAAPEVTADPFPYYEILRRTGPVVFLPRHDFWLVLGCDAVRSAFTQPVLFSNRPYDPIDAVLLAADPPRHARIHRLIVPLFSPDVLRRLSSIAEERAERLIKPEMDAVGDYGMPLSHCIAAELIGFDDETVADILAAGEAARRAPAPVAALIRSLDELAHRATLYGRLLRDGEGCLGDAEVRSLIRLLWLAATTTTQRVIARGVLRLLEHPELREEIQGNFDLLAPFIEEVLRLHPPEHMVPRITTGPAELEGVVIPHGASVQLCVTAANRDPLHFEDPAQLRLRRAHQRHFAFGSGVHYCTGTKLARGVVEIALRTLMQSAPRFRALRSIATVPYLQTMTALTPERLMIETRPD